MRNLKKNIIVLIMITLLVLSMYKVFKIINNKELVGSIEVITDEENYVYLKDSAEKFMSANKKSKINVTKNNKDEMIEYLNKASNVENEINLMMLDSKTLRSINDDSLENISYQDNIIDSYSKNFNLWRLNEVKKGEHYLGLPIQSNPQFLIIREDILNQYGYKSEDIRSWNELIDLYKYIDSKSNNEISLFSYDLTTIEEIEKIIIYQGGNINQAEEITNIIKDDNLMGKETPLGYIADKNNYKNIINNNLKNSLKAIMIPAIVVGGNRAVSFDGDNIVALKSEYERQDVANRFLRFLIDNQNLISVDTLNNEGFFPSSRAFYNNIVVDKEFEEINNQKVLSIMTNIVNRVPDTTDYDRIDDILDVRK